MGERALGAGGAIAGATTAGARSTRLAPAFGGALAAVAAAFDRIRPRPSGRRPTAFPAAAGATDRDLARLGRQDNPAELLREARLMAVSRAGYP